MHIRHTGAENTRRVGIVLAQISVCIRSHKRNCSDRDSQAKQATSELEICKSAFKILRETVELSKNNHLKVRKFRIQFNLKETQAFENLPMHK